MPRSWPTPWPPGWCRGHKAAELVRARGLPETAQEALVDLAVDAPVERVAAAVQQARLAHGSPPPVVEPELYVTRRADHALLEATVDLVDAEILDVALSTMVEAQNLPVDIPYPQRRARALTGLARYYLDHQHQAPTGRVGRPHVLVLVDLEVLRSPHRRIRGAGLGRSSPGTRPAAWPTTPTSPG